jgi:hypothetical protein
MLVYRNNRRPRRPAELLSSIVAEVARLAAGTPGADAIRDLLVAFDALEGGVADVLNPETDGTGPLQNEFRRMALALAGVFLHSLAGRTTAVAAGLRRQQADLTVLQRCRLPATIMTAEAEGYAWYGLFPETYALTARRFLAEFRPHAAVCIGIRQIGCSLSAVAAAVLAAAGCPVALYTVRPRGHPFERSFLPAPDLAAELRRHADAAHFLLIDEGPGLSGSSFACVAEVLAGWGIADDRILFFPSWAPDASRLLSAVARRRWPRHRALTAGFHPVPQIKIDSKAQMRALDLSGGRWRELLLPRSAWPPVQPQHEKRKFLFHPAGAPPLAKPEACILARFGGFGEVGQAGLQRAGRLAAAGFTPPVLGRQAGFLLSRFLPGQPLAAASVTSTLLERIAAYLASLRQDFPAPNATPPEELFAMLRHNVAAGLGEKWAARLPDLAALYIPAPAIAIDGRMLPHEWLQTPAGFVKTDALDHHADHFYPGATDIAWDLAATEIEFCLTPAQSEFLRRRYAALSGDVRGGHRLPFHRLAWLAFRLGYTRLAADTLGAGEEAERFRRSAELNACRLQREIVANY